MFDKILGAKKIIEEGISVRWLWWDIKNKDALIKILEIQAPVINHLKQSIAVKRKNIWYAYWTDYQKRLITSSEELDNIFNDDIVAGWEIWFYYNWLKAVVSKIDGWDRLIENIKKSLFEDLIYESLDINNLSWTWVYLDLSNTNISMMDDTLLAESVSRMMGVQGLSLWSNNLGLLGAKKLLVLVGWISDIKSLDLQNNMISAMTNQEMSIFVKWLISLKSANFSFNDIGLMEDETLFTLFDGIKKIRYLDLWCNSLGLMDRKKFTRFVLWIQWVKYLNLQGNTLSDKQKKYMQDQLVQADIVF